MAELPTGTVTFLFTDIEGSTRLLQELGDRYVLVQDEHAAIVRQATAEAGGVQVSTEGDSFFLVFPNPAGAVRAAVAAQRGLATHDWSPGPRVRVRMGLHTGEGVRGGDNYVGIDVNRAARIAAAAHGGQVILSDATRGLVERSLPDGASLRDLGEHRLKDIAHPEHLHDLVIEGLPADFPPPRTLDARPNNLPLQLTSFVGREEPIAEIRELLGRTRLLTLTGAGGTGKSRLALQVATEILTEYRDGSFFVDLSPVTDPALVPSAIAQALGVPEVAGRPILEAVKTHLHDQELLLVVDNFEQVAAAGSVVEELLTAAPKLKALVTSRVVLSLRGEQEYAVPPLEPPDPERLPDILTLGRFEAVRLFTERAVEVRPGFRVTEENARAVAEITARLDGLPLAIELAATRTKVLTPEQILPRLQKRFSILSSRVRTLPERQRTLRGAIAWSYDLLDDVERRLFARLSVFIGGWTLEAAEAVCDPEGIGLDALEGLTSLLDKSLVRRDEPADGHHPRFFMLETIREFAQEQLQGGGDLDLVLRRHSEHFLALAVEAEPHLTADDQVEWLDRCDQEHANIRAALRWAIEAGAADRALESAGALWRFWQQRGHLAEGRGWFEEILAMPSGQGRSPARAKALTGAAGIAWWRQDRGSAGAFYGEALAIARELGDPARIAEALYNDAFVVAGDDLESATRMLEESLDLFRGVGDERGVAQVLTMLVMQDAQAGRWTSVIDSLEEVTAIWRRVGDRLHLAFDLVWLAFAHGRGGHRAEARSAALEALELFREVDNLTGIGIVFTDLAFLANWEGRHQDAIRLAGASESLRRRVGGPPGAIGGLLEGDPVAEASAHLAEDEAKRAWQEGLAMSVDEAMALARSEPGA
ncbi:MAG: adenylate/guanylate cyclase domain-containing protein [Actinobacteria bacterium]|nr:MAG: adenylate/guanylate cyclase domain-containing protein [Actinomycetota bacterium]